LVSINSGNATATSNPDVETLVNANILRADDVLIEASSIARARAVSSNLTAGGIAIGKSDATANSDNHVLTNIGSGTIFAAGDVAIFATGVQIVSSKADTNGSFAAVTSADADALTDLDYDVLVSSDATIEAGRTVLIESRVGLDAGTTSKADATALAGFANASGTILVGSSSDRALSQVVLNDDSDINADLVVIASRAGSQSNINATTGDVETDGSGLVTEWSANATVVSDNDAIPVANSISSASVQTWDLVETILDGGSAIEANGDIELYATHYNTQLEAHSDALYLDYDNAVADFIASLIDLIVDIFNPIPVTVDSTANVNYDSLTRVSGRHDSFLQASDVLVDSENSASVTRDADRSEALANVKILDFNLLAMQVARTTPEQLLRTGKSSGSLTSFSSVSPIPSW
jgi:hypothetical protein